MNAEVFPIFATPLYRSKLNFDHKKILDIAEKKEYNWLTNANNGYKTNESYILNCSEFTQLKQEIKKHIHFFVHDILKVRKDIKFYITNSWIMKHKKGNWSQNHHHSNSLISGIYYINVNEETGKIYFNKSQHFLNLFPSFFKILFDDYNYFNSRRIEILPCNDDLLLFPSHLYHEVEENKSEENRYCLAFNCFIETTLGQDSDMDTLIFK
jgi:uncharacterized protein (TIGR02466 family)